MMAMINVLWSALQASANSLNLDGVDGLTLAGNDLQVMINEGSDLDGSVLDFSGDNALTTEVVSGVEFSLDIDGGSGGNYPCSR